MLITLSRGAYAMVFPDEWRAKVGYPYLAPFRQGGVTSFRWLHMAAPLYGLDAELAAKQAAKYSPELEHQASAWIKEVTGVDVGANFAEGLKSGVVLCQLINAIKPGTVAKINNQKMAFMQMENINAFLAGCRSLGMQDQDMFMTVDLFEEKNIGQVVQCIHGLGRAAQRVGYNGATLGPKEAEKNARVFTAQQMADAKNAVPLLDAGMNQQAKKGVDVSIRHQQVRPGAATASSEPTKLTQGSTNAAGVQFGARREIGGQYPNKE